MLSAVVVASQARESVTKSGRDDPFGTAKGRSSLGIFIGNKESIASIYFWVGLQEKVKMFNVCPSATITTALENRKIRWMTKQRFLFVLFVSLLLREWENSFRWWNLCTIDFKRGNLKKLGTKASVIQRITFRSLTCEHLLCRRFNARGSVRWLVRRSIGLSYQFKAIFRCVLASL